MLQLPIMCDQFKALKKIYLLCYAQKKLASADGGVLRTFSPLQVTRPVDASKVKCYGPGVDRVHPLFSTAPQEFTVDTSEAGDADLEVTVDAPGRKVLKPEPICEKGDGVYTVQYTPEEEG